MDRIRIGKIWYPVKTLGYGNRLGIWMQGCAKRCKDCISPEMQPTTGGKEIAVSEIIAYAVQQAIDGLTVSGGEPFDQEEGLLELVRRFRPITDDILIYTGYTLQELRSRQSAAIEEILGSIAVLIDGTYQRDKNDGIGLRGSSNQKIHIYRYASRYADAETMDRKLQCVMLPEHLWMIGIPPGDGK